MIRFGFKTKERSKTVRRAGLDIGSFAVKVVEAENHPDRPSITALGTKRIRGYSREAIVDAIKSLAQEAGLSTREVNIGVCGASVIVRFLSMPMMSDNELKGAIRFEAEKFMPFDINDCVIDFQVMRKDARSNNLEIVIAAAKKDYVEERIALVESSGYSVGIVDVDSFAVTNSFLRNVPDAEPEKTVALLNIGSALTNLSIIKGGIAYFVRDIVIGGNDFSVAISKSLNVDIDAAEEIKISPQSRAGEILPSLKASFASLADEIKLSCNYYENQYGKSVDDFYISGGTSDLIEFESIFQEAIGSKPKRWNPTVFLEDNCIPAPVGLKDSVKNSFAVAVGLALRGEDRGRQ